MTTKKANDELLKTPLRIAGVVEESVVDGTGIRFTVFVQGCLHKCKGCHNPQTHSLSDGEIITIGELFEKISSNPLLDGVTFSGGEPFLYPLELSLLSRLVGERGLNVWCYTGYTYEQLLDMAQECQSIQDLLDGIDVLVDGQFVEEKKDLLLRFRGSSNQRIIDLKKMRESNNLREVVLLWN